MLLVPARPAGGRIAPMGSPRFQFRLTAERIAVALAVAATALCAVIITASLLPVPPGARIRPMGMACLLVPVYLVAPLVVALLSIYGIAKNRAWVVGLIGLILAPAPIVIARILVDWIVASRNLELSP